MENPEDILNDNYNTFKEAFIEGVENKGFGILLVDTNKNNYVFITIEDAELIDDTYNTDTLINKKIIDHFINNPPKENYMYVCMIIDEEMSIISSYLYS
tara:strand:- start:4110 stop:4406 length:297 start_codon:yes stop_codon:yes gene_type:complete